MPLVARLPAGQPDPALDARSGQESGLRQCALVSRLSVDKARLDLYGYKCNCAPACTPASLSWHTLPASSVRPRAKQRASRPERASPPGGWPARSPRGTPPGSIRGRLPHAGDSGPRPGSRKLSPLKRRRQPAGAFKPACAGGDASSSSRPVNRVARRREATKNLG